MRLWAAALVALTGLLTTSCKLITEQMPASANPVDTATPTPKPNSTKPTAATATSTTAATATAAATPTRTPKPTEPPTEPTNVPGCPASWPPSCQPPVTAGVVVFYTACAAGAIPDSKFASSTQASCEVRLDVTPKDANRVPTQTNEPTWHFDFGSLPYTLEWPADHFTPTIHGNGVPGTFTAYCTIVGLDGVTTVTSNTLTFTFTP